MMARPVTPGPWVLRPPAPAAPPPQSPDSPCVAARYCRPRSYISRTSRGMTSPWCTAGGGWAVAAGAAASATASAHPNREAGRGPPAPRVLAREHAIDPPTLLPLVGRLVGEVAVPGERRLEPPRVVEVDLDQAPLGG